MKSETLVTACLERIAQRDRVLHCHARSGSNRKVRGVSGIPKQHDVAA